MSLLCFTTRQQARRQSLLPNRDALWCWGRHLHQHFSHFTLLTVTIKMPKQALRFRLQRRLCRRHRCVPTSHCGPLLGPRLWIRGVGSNPLLRRNLFIHLSFCLLQQLQKRPRRMFRPCWRSRLRPLLRQCRRAATTHCVPLLGAMLWIRGVGRNPLFPRI